MPARLHLLEQPVHAPHFLVCLDLVYVFERLVARALKVLECGSLDLLNGVLVPNSFNVVIIVFERPAIVPHGHAGLLDGGKVFLGLFLDDDAQIFFLGVGEVCHVGLFADGNPGGRVRDQSLPVNVGEEWVFLELLDAVRRPKSLLGVPH